MGTEFFEPTTTEGGPARRRQSVADRQATAQRFLFEAADDMYDGELDIDWDAAPVPDKQWLPEAMVSLYGTGTWESMPPAKRAELAKRELVNLLTVATYAETVLSMLTFREIAEDQSLADDRTRWLLKCVDTHARTMTMFGRLIDVTGLPAYTHRRVTRRLEKYTLLLPAGVTTALAMLLLESTTQGLTRLMAADDTVQPHVRQITTIHQLTSGRHLRFAHEELQRSAAGAGPARRVAASLAGAGIVAIVGRLTVNPTVYRDAAIPLENRDRALRSPSHGRLMTAVFDDAIQAAADTGLFHDRLSRVILRRSLAPTPTSRRRRS